VVRRRWRTYDFVTFVAPRASLPFGEVDSKREVQAPRIKDAPRTASIEYKNPPGETPMKTLLKSALAIAAAALCTAASAGDIYLTGHDVDFHDNQNGYDKVILDYLRGSTAAASYRVGIVTGSVGFGSIGNGFGTRTERDIQSFADAGAFATFLSGIDVLIVASEESCGGCTFSTADVAKLNSFQSQVTSFFNAGGDIFGQTGGTDAAYYGFLPPSAVATGASISGSSGFTATAAGLAIGIQSNNINGFATHNRFTAFDPAFTVMEVRGSEVISLALKDGTIGGGGVITVPSIPEPETYALMAFGLAAVGFAARRRRQA
jgi:hypothetical protein